MEYKRLGHPIVVRLERGEEIIDSLKQFCTDQKIEAGWVLGLGAVSQATLSYYLWDEKRYVDRHFDGDMEITSLTGDIAILEGEVFPHLHITLSNQECQVFGGHLTAASISATGELMVLPFSGRLDRRLFPELGLKLLDLSEQ